MPISISSALGRRALVGRQFHTLAGFPQRIIAEMTNLTPPRSKRCHVKSSAIVKCGVSWDDDALITVNQDDVRSPLDPMLPDRYSRIWGEMLDGVGAARVPLHSARHASVSQMRDKGIPAHLVAAHHGHDEAMTTQIYTHVQDFSQLAAVMSS